LLGAWQKAGGKAVEHQQKKKTVEHLRIGSGRMQMSFQNAHFLGGYPGVGGSFYLPRLRRHVGFYLALTGARINVEDALYAGAVTHYVQTHRLDKLQKALTDSDFNVSDEEVMAIVDDFAVSASQLELIHQDPHFKAHQDLPASSYYQRYVLQGVPEPTHLADNIDDIDRCFGQPTFQGLLEELRGTDSPWGRSALGPAAPMLLASFRVPALASTRLRALSRVLCSARATHGTKRGLRKGRGWVHTVCRAAVGEGTRTHAHTHTHTHTHTH